MVSSASAPATSTALVALPHIISPRDLGLEAMPDPIMDSLPNAAPNNAAPIRVLSGAKPPALLCNRVREILWHIPWYGFKTQARLAEDSGVSPAAISRLIRGESQPSLAVALRLTAALSRRLGRPLDVSEVFSLGGSYPTSSVCHLTHCRNCLPPDYYDDQDEIKPFYRGVKAGQWSPESNETKSETKKPSTNQTTTDQSETNQQTKGGA